MDTQTLQVFSLRGMDERWIVQPQDALFIEDMTWTSNDSWKTSGGFFQVYKPDPFFKTVSGQSLGSSSFEKINVAPEDNILYDYTGPIALKTEPVETDFIVDPSSPEVPYAYARFPKIKSLHWFAQHNGARQWLMMETQNGGAGSGLFGESYDLEEVDEHGVPIPNGTLQLKFFSGAKVYFGDGIPSEPTERVFEYGSEPGDPLRSIAHRRENILSPKTTSQSYGGRIYFVNGNDDPIVFDGRFVERVGFFEKPPPPTGLPSNNEDAFTFPYAEGNFYSPNSDSSTVMSTKIMDGDYEEGPAGFTSEDFFRDKGTKTPNRWSEHQKPNHTWYSAHKDVPFCGVGSTSTATIGAGEYKFDFESKDNVNDAMKYFDVIKMRMDFYGAEQVDTRKCGYQYKVTYVNERGQESEPSDPSRIVTVENGTGGKKNANHGKGAIAVSISIGPKECCARRIYRTRNVFDSNGDLYTTGDQRSFYFLTEIQDNMTETYLDFNPDTALGELIDTRDFGNFPQNTNTIAVFKNTMFAAGENLNEIKFSAPLFPEVFPKDNILQVGDDDGGPITGMRTTKNALVVFKNRGIYLIKGDPLKGFFAQTLNKDVGCIAPSSIAEVPGLGLAFLSQGSVHLLEGALENTGTPTGIVNIGAEIPNQLERINMSAAGNASAAVYLKDKEYWLSVPIDGSSENNMCLIYHYEVGSWSVRRNFPIECMVTSKDHRGYLFMGSHDDRNLHRAGLLVYSRGTYTKGYEAERKYAETESGGLTEVFDGGIYPDRSEFKAVPVSPSYETVSNDYGSLFSSFRPAHIMAYAVAYGDNRMQVDTRVNRSMRKIRPSVQSAQQQDPNDVSAVYGTARFDSTEKHGDIWTEYRPTVIRYDVSTSHKGPVREMSVTFAALDSNKIQILGYDVEAKVGEQNKIKPLNKALKPSRR